MSSKVIGIDLGTVNTVVSYKGNVIKSLPTVVAYDTVGDQKFFGQDAVENSRYHVEGVKAVWPMVEGRISDDQALRDFLENLLDDVCKKIFKFRSKADVIVVAIPCELPELYKNPMESAVLPFTSKFVLVEQPVAAVFGNNTDLFEEQACILVCDIGGGTTDWTAVTRKGTVKGSSRSIQIAGNRMDECIKRHVQRNFNANIPLDLAQRIKHTIGCAATTNRSNSEFMRFKAYNSSGEVSVRLLAEEMPEILSEPLEQIVASGIEWCANLTENNPEALIRLEEGRAIGGVKLKSETCYLLLTGGGSQLSGMDKLLSDRLGIAVKVADNALDSAGIGAERIGLDSNLMNRFQISVRDRKYPLTLCDVPQTKSPAKINAA